MVMCILSLVGTTAQIGIGVGIGLQIGRRIGIGLERSAQEFAGKELADLYEIIWPNLVCPCSRIPYSQKWIYLVKVMHTKTALMIPIYWFAPDARKSLININAEVE